MMLLPKPNQECTKVFLKCVDFFKSVVAEVKKQLEYLRAKVTHYERAIFR